MGARPHANANANANANADTALHAYRAKRDFKQTPEPAGQRAGQRARQNAGDSAQHSFVVQKHAATRLHYDFRLELDGVMLSWAVPKGPSLDPADKRLAVQVEDHPVSYGSFEGTIPPLQYGAGTVIVWDRGTWQPAGDPHEGLRAGKLRFELHGEKLQGQWELIRTQGSGKPNWLLFKKRDAFARPHAEYDVVSARPDSVITRPRVALPATLSPQLATLASIVPSTGDWVYELKFDGYRLLSRIEHGQVQLFTRGAKDWTSRLPVLAHEVGRLGISTGWIDGEIVVLGDDGRPDFNALQNAFDEALTERVVYYVFDLPYSDAGDLRALPLLQRRQALKQIVDGHRSEHVRFSEAFEADPHNIIQAACKLNLEGVVAKRADAPYVTHRSLSWLKLKCKQRQEFVIGGFTDRGQDGDAAEIGSLVLGVHDAKGRLLSVGRVGTGWSLATARQLKKRLAALETSHSPFVRDARGSPRTGPVEERGVTWVEPELVAEVSFAQWTPQGHVRHAVFHGLRSDKPAAAIVREVAVEPARALKNAAAPSPRVTHPQRVIDAASGITKLDLVRYYESVAERMLPHLKARPCSLLRGPTGVEGELFFQKHAGRLRLPDIKVLPATLWPGHEPLLEVATPAALAGAAQMNVIEFHTWNSTTRRIDRPDRVVFDLDPGEGVAWAQVQEAATLTRALLAELGLKSWLKTSGGKGLHLFVPLAMRHDEATVKAFAQAAVQHLARVMPQRFVAKSGPSNRIGKVFVDHLRNGHGATTAAAFSARARPGLGVSMPVDWGALPALKSGAHFTVVNARDYLSFEREDPWADYWRTHQSLARAIKDLWISGVRD